MSDSTIKGKVGVIEPTQTFGSKGFRKRLVVLEQEESKWTNWIPLTFTGDACDSPDLNTLVVGDEIEATYRLNGRKWQRDENSDVRYFLDAEVIRFEVVSKVKRETPADAPAPWTVDEMLEQKREEEPEVDIPF